MKSEKASSGADQESEIWNAIAAFERILEVMPDDRMSLETLVHAYGQLGDMTRARDYLIRLAKVVADENDAEPAAEVLDQLRRLGGGDPEVEGLKRRLAELASRGGAVPVPAPATEPQAKPTELRPYRVNITDELALAWDLLQVEELTQEQYAEVVQDLTDISSNASDEGAVSMLHVIDNRGAGNMERVLTFAAKKAETPILRLSDFEISDEAAELLPIKVMVKNGVLPFDLLGPDALVVIQNPYDREFRKWVEQMTGRHCHFFLTSPQEFHSAIERLVRKASEPKTAK